MPLSDIKLVKTLFFKLQEMKKEAEIGWSHGEELILKLNHWIGNPNGKLLLLGASGRNVLFSLST